LLYAGVFSWWEIGLISQGLTLVQLSFRPAVSTLTLDVPLVELLVVLSHLPSAVHQELLNFGVLISAQLEIHQLTVIANGGLITLLGIEVPNERFVEHFPGFR
jgi:hypothetical protein